MHFEDKGVFPDTFQPDARSHVHDAVHSLSKEAQELIEQREEAEQAIAGINNRLTQIAGAIDALHKLLEKL